MAGERKLTVTFDGKDVGLKKAADDAVDTVQKSGDGIGSAFKDVGKVAGGFLVAELTTQLADWGRQGLSWLWDGTKLASDTKESMNKVDVVFGQSANTIRDFARGAAQNIGLSERAALDATGTFGNMFDQLGFGSTLAADMSTSMLTLSADIASFHNADITDVIDAQSSAFRGEYDSLQRFIPTINAAAVEQEALTLTGKKSADQLTQQEKAMGAFNLMLEGAGKASGDFAATMDSQANQERIAAAEAENLQANLGEKLLPVTEAVTAAKRKLVEVLANDVIPWVTETGTKIRDNLQPAWQWLVDHKDEIWGAFSEVGRVINEELKPAIDDLIAAAREVLQDVDWQTVWQELGPILQQVGTVFLDLMVTVITVMATIISNTADAINTLKRLWDEHATIREVVREVWDWISTKITTALGIISGVMRLITAVMQGDWSGAWNAIKQIASNAWDSMTADFRAMRNTISSLGANMWNSISSGLQSVVDSVVSQINRLIRAYNSIPFLPNVSQISTGLTKSASTISKGATSFGGAGIAALASGGVVTRPTLAWLAEDGQPEAVVPLNRAGGMGLGGGQLTIGSDGTEMGDLLVAILRRAVRNRGGLDVVFT
jgi:hypothetical protein